MTEWITNNVWKIVAVVSPVIVWFLKDSKLFKRDLEKQDSDIISNNLDIYQKMLDHLDIKLEDKEGQITILEGKLHDAQELKSSLESNIRKLERTVKDLTRKLEEH